MIKIIENKIIYILVLLWLASLIVLFHLERESSKEADSGLYNKVLSLAKNCDRDKCDEIIDALDDEILTIKEAGIILFFTESLPRETNDDAKTALIEYVSENTKFRNKG